MSMEFIRKHRFIGILRHIPVSKVLPVAQAMYDGGIRIFEVTFDPAKDTTCLETGSMIRQLREHFGPKVSVGAGTVLNVSFAEAAYESGAEFIVAPNTDSAVIAYTKSKGLLSVPGAYTPSEIVNAYALGADIVKIFPILPDGEAYLKNIISPLSHIPFMVTGGINPNTVEKFLATGAVAVAAGATIVTRELAEAEDYDTIRANAESHIRHIR